MATVENSPGPAVNEHAEGDKAARLWFILAIVWFAVFTTFGFLLATKFFFPNFLGGEEILTFGRIRPAHTNGVLFGFVSSGLLGIMFWIVPRLCGRALFRPDLAKLAAILWNGSVLAGIIWIMFGGSQGREYAELPWAIDVLVMAGLILMGYIVFGTIRRRTEKKLYGSLWYYAGTLVWFPIVYFIGNVMWHPATGALSGVTDAIFNWYYGHNVLGLWFTTLGIPAWYYFIPKLTNRPLYSHLLSLIGFFSIAFFYTGVGAHHLLQAPIPEWLKTIAVLMSVLMLVPVLAFATNITLTMRGSWHKLTESIPLRFMMAGFIAYILVSLQGTFQALRSTNLFLHFSQWPVGHAHLALLGGFGFLAAGAAFYLVPKITGVKIWSESLMRLSFWVAFIGFVSFFAAMSTAGLVANSNWFVHINVVETLPTLKVHFIWRAISGGIIVLAAYMMAYNLWRTFRHSRELHTEEVHEPVEAITEKPHPEWMRRSHRTLDLRPILFGGLTVFIIMTFMVVAMPYMFTTTEPPNTARAQPLSTEQAAGEQTYKSMGCFYCHNQFVRTSDWAMGVPSEAGDFYYSVPNFLGTERTGPSLSQIGGKRPTEWHLIHDRDPRSVSPSSIMPPFGFLSESELNSLVDYIQNLGGEDLEPDAFQPPIPPEYQGQSNPNLPLMQQVAQGYDAENQEYTGDETAGKAWADTYDGAKQLYTEKCLSCHGCSGNGQGPYARQTLTHPANLHERIANFPNDSYDFWRVSAGVPGTAMPSWGLSQTEDTIWKLNTYELSFVGGAIRTVSGDVSDTEGDAFNDSTGILPPITGTEQQYTMGQQLFNLYCAQCHGEKGLGDGPASINSPEPGGYIQPEPANFEESGSDFTNYGRWVWKVKEGVETTNMPPWKYALSDDEIYRLIFYIQGFSKPEDYNSKWAPLYSDPFAKNLKGG